MEAEEGVELGPESGDLARSLGLGLEEVYELEPGVVVDKDQHVLVSSCSRGDEGPCDVRMH